MNARDAITLMPLLILTAAPVAIMLVIAVRRSHILTFALSAGAVVAALAAIPPAAALAPRQVSALLIIDAYALLFTGLILLAGLFVLLLSYDYRSGTRRAGRNSYLLLLTALLGAAILAASSHFASFFLGLEILERLPVRADCLPANQRALHRGGDQVPDPRGLLVCHPALRDGPGLRPLGDPGALRRRRRCSGLGGIRPSRQARS